MTKTSSDDALNVSGVSTQRDEDLPEISTRKQVSGYTGISLPTLTRWAAGGKGPRFKKAGGRVIYRRADVLAWLEELPDGGEAA